MKSMKQILAEFREYSQKVNSLEKVIENRNARARQLKEDRELFSEITRDSAEKIYQWMRDTQGMPYDFEELFDGAMRTYIPLASEEQVKLSKIVKALRRSGWEVPADPKYDGSIKKFAVNKVKQKLQRLQADGGGEYEVEIDVADLRLVKKTQKTIPAGPRAGQTVEKKEDTTMSKAIARLAKSGMIEKDLLEWWQNTQGSYTRDGNHKTIEKSFLGEDGSQYSVVLSRHPIDVLRMSDISNIRSCHSEGSEYFQCAIAEAKGHGPIAYLVLTEDLENHLIEENADGSPTEMITRWAQELNQAEYTEKVQAYFDLDTPAGRWVYLERWAESGDGENWLKMAPTRFEMASHPEKFMVSAIKAKARSIGVEAEELRHYYREWLKGESIEAPAAAIKDYTKAVAALSDQQDAQGALKPLSDFDDQEIFRDRQRSIQGIGAAGRLRLRKFEEPMRHGTFAVPEQRTYGLHVPGFKSAVMKWATEGQREQFVDDDGDISNPRFEDLTRRGGSYGDNRDGEILNAFFREMHGKSDDDEWEAPYNPHFDASTDDDDEEDENERLFEEYEERVSELQDHADRSLKHAYANATVEDYGEGEPYVSADGGVSYEIVLNGWEGYEEDEDNDIVRLDKDGERVEDSFVIPRAWGGDYQRRRAFEDALDDTLDYYPEETDWDVSGGDGKPVILEVRHTLRMEDGHTPDDYDNFIDYVISGLDANYRENKEKIRRSLVEGEWLSPNDWDNLQDDISEMEQTLKNWSVFGVGDDDGEVIFSLRPGRGVVYGRTHMLTGIKWPYPSGNNLSTVATLKGLFGGEVKTFGIEKYLSLNSGSPGTVLAKGGVLFKRAFKGLQDAANEYAQRQMSLDFGPEYKEKYAPIEMGKNVELGLNLVDPSDTYTGSDGSLELGFIMKVRVYSEDRSDEIEAAFNFVKYIDSNMDSLRKAVANAFTSEIDAWNEQRKADERAMTDGSAMQRYASQLALRWDDAATEGNQWAEAMMILVMWTQQNFKKMKTLAEKWVATDMLRLHVGGTIGAIWDHDEDLPANWNRRVKEKMVQLGATFNQKEFYNADYLKDLNPKPEADSQEDEEPMGLARLGTALDQGGGGPIVRRDELREIIYKRLQKKILKKKVKSHITEKLSHQKELQKQKVRELVKSKLSGHGLTEVDLGYTQRTYKINFRIAMSKEHGGKREETENEMRAVPGVGTVKILVGTTRQDGSNYYADVMIKFHLLGKRSVVQYIRLELLPALRSIEGLSVLRMDRYEEITTMREWADAFANAGASPQQGSGTARRSTPTPTIDSIAQDWINIGKDGTANIHASSLAHNTAEVTMIPVEELMRYLGTNYFSATTKEFEMAKQQIINGGVPHPVQVAIGKNGRVKITAGNDLVLAAKDIGLKELPTTFSLQLQV